MTVTDRIVRNFLSLLLLTLILVLAMGCERKSKALEATIVGLESSIQEKDTLLASLYTDMATIENELYSVSEKHSDGSVMIPLAQESDWSSTHRIMDEIRFLNDLIQSKSDKIQDIEAQLASARSQLSNSGKSNSQLTTQIAGLEQQLKDANSEINTAKQNLEQKAEEMALLRTNLENRLSEIAMLETQMLNKDMENLMLARELDEKNTGYYISGKYKELKSAGILERKGGIAGVGAVKQLREDFDTEKFKSIDIRNTPSIPLASEKVEIVTSHPEGSYAFKEEEGKITGLEITDPDDFWKAGQVLVMVTK